MRPSRFFFNLLSFSFLSICVLPSSAYRAVKAVQSVGSENVSFLSQNTAPPPSATAVKIITDVLELPNNTVSESPASSNFNKSSTEQPLHATPLYDSTPQHLPVSLSPYNNRRTGRQKLHRKNGASIRLMDQASSSLPSANQIKVIVDVIDERSPRSSSANRSPAATLALDSPIFTARHNRSEHGYENVLLQLNEDIDASNTDATEKSENSGAVILPTREPGESLQNYYNEWLQLLLEEIRGAEWAASSPQTRRVKDCRENIRLENQGCALLVPTCKNFSTTEGISSRTGWSCEMSLWHACTCSRPYTSFLKYLVPPSRECYGNMLHSTDLVTLLDIPFSAETAIDDSHMVLLPVGYCGWSGFFAFYVVMMTSVLGALVGVLWKPFSRTVQYIQRKRLQRGQSGSLSGTNNSNSLFVRYTTSTALKDN